MNDTENQLRDYLQAKAATVQDTDQGPGLELDSTTRKRAWVPIALAAATIGAVLILAVPFLTSLADNQPSPAATPTARPTGPVPAGAPRLPYSITVPDNPDNPLDTWWKVIHDGKQTVKNPGVKGKIVARLAEGWLVTTGYPDPKKSQAAIVGRDGKVRPIGPLGADKPAVSPDGKQLAVPVAPYGAKDSQVVIVNVADGKEAARIRIPTPMLSSFGWNKAGIWMYMNNAERQPMLLWQPGWKEARTLPDLGGEIALARDSDTFGYTVPDGKGGFCAKAATLGANGPEVKREYCSKHALWPRLTLSPDGGTLLVNGPSVAVDIATGRTTKVNLPAGFVADQMIFEDTTDVIVLDGVAKMYRCRVTTGECKVLPTKKPDGVVRIAAP